MKKHLPIIVAFLLSLAGAQAQPIFNYNEITICEGGSYDLLRFQTDEVIVPVGWEIIGWQGVTNTTVMPAVSPTVYTLEYHEITNPSVIYTQNLTVSLRPKPTVSITPSGKQEICDGLPIHIEKTDAANYDDLYWIYVQTSQKHYTENIDAIAVRGNAENKMTYKLIATNNECAVVAQDEMEYSVVKDDEYPIYRFQISYNSYENYPRLIGNISYCGTTNVATYMTPYRIVVSTNVTGDMAFDPYSSDLFTSLPPNNEALYINPQNQYQKSENDIVKLMRYEVKWETEDIYTQGAEINGISYSNKYTLEVDLYFKACGTTKTYYYYGELNLYPSCPQGSIDAPWISYSCSEINGQGMFGVQTLSGGPIIDYNSVIWENLTLPGQYIPQNSGSTYSYTKFDASTPSQMQYRITVNYIDKKGVSMQMVADRTFSTCYIKTQISYASAYHNGYNFIPWLAYNDSYYAPTYVEGDVGRNYEGKTTVDTIETTVCLGSPAYLSIASNVKGKQHVLWRNFERPVMLTSGNYLATNYTYDRMPNGYELLVDSVPCMIFKVNPTQTTVYTGTLEGLEFAFKVNVVNNHIAAIDTAICRGQSIDLKTLERIENINGTVSWNVTNTIVTPMVDTKYVVYGIARDKCPAQGDYTITDEVTVYVDENIWSDGGALTASCVGDWIDLTDALNTNGRKLQWYDASGNELPDGIIKVANDTFYRVEMRNGCGTKIDTVSVKVTDECLTYHFAQNDTVAQKQCFDPVIPFKRAFVYPLDNDNCPCDNPVLTIITPPTNPEATAGFHTTYKQLTYFFNNTSGPIKDSVQYEVCCGFKCATAWAFFDIRDEGMEIIDIEVTPAEIILSLTGTTKNGTYTFYAMNESGTFVNYNSTPLTNLGDTVQYVFSDGSVLEDGKYYVEVIDNYTMCFIVDSIIIKDGQIVPLCPPDTLHLFDTIFVGEDYSKNGFELPVQHTDTVIYDTLFLKNQTLCDSTVVLNLKVESSPCAPTSSTQNKTVCANELPYFWDGLGFYIAGTQEKVLTNAGGCDSTATFSLTVKPAPSVSVVEREICQNDTVHLEFTGVAPFKMDYLFNGIRDSIGISSMDTMFIATQAGENVFVVHSLVSDNACSSESIDPDGVNINGLIWATRNVDMPGTFAANLEDAGMLYQWNKNVGWSTTDPAINSDNNTDWISTYSTSKEWEAVNDPCPSGWRVPTYQEIAGLNYLSQWTTTPVDGRIYGTAPNTIFLPIAGYRTSQNVLITNSSFYWGNFPGTMLGYGIVFNETDSKNTSTLRAFAASVRCVKEFPLQKDTVTVYPIKQNTIYETIYSTDSILFHDIYYRKEGTYTATLKTVNGCDSTVVLNLTVKEEDDEEADAIPVVSSYTENDICDDNLCKYEGPSILINEVMIAPSKYDGSIYGIPCGGTASGGEWIELYNPDNCNPIDISGYFFGNATTDRISSGCNLLTRNLGAAFVLPQGTVVPPNGFCVLRGERAEKVDSTRLVENGGNVVVINFTDHIDRFCLNNGGLRFWLPNAGGWFGFYDKEGVPQDAVYWGKSEADIYADCMPCNPSVEETYQGELASLDDFPANKKTWIDDRDLTNLTGKSHKRQPDGGSWSLNTLTPPTEGYCNGACYSRVSDDCNGTATVAPEGGSDNFSYQWDDANNQTTATATGLCEGTYCCLITDDETLLTQVACVTIINHPVNCASIVAINDKILVTSCETTTLYIPFLDNDRYSCAPVVTLLSSPLLSGNTAIIVNDILVFKIAESNINKKDSVQYRIECNHLLKDSAWIFIEVKSNTLRTTLAKTICQNDNILFKGQYYNLSGTYIDTLQSIYGCDSIVTLNLTVKDTLRSNITAAICQGETYTLNGFNTNKTGVYTRNLKTVNGCDSIVTLNLTVNDTVRNSITATICQGQTYSLNGFNANSTGIYTRNLKTINGCDSIITLTLIVNRTERTDFTADICQGENYVSNGFSANSTGIYTQNLKTVNGCDSTVTLNLTVHSSDTVITQIISCEDSYTWQGITYTENGNYEQKFINQYGCDSTEYLHLTLNYKDSINLTLSACDSYSWNGTSYTRSGIYEQKFTGLYGCDSTVVLDLEVKHVEVELVSSEQDFCETMQTTLTVNTNVLEILWNTGENTPFIEVSKPGLYTVTAIDPPCQKTDSLQIPDCSYELFLPNAITPSASKTVNDYFSIHEKYHPYLETVQVYIFNRWGEQIYESNKIDFKWNGLDKGKLYPNNVYTYVLHVFFRTGDERMYKGIITVL